ncbi:hypothetical protein Tco_0694533 [Tanacetum coccineum]
MPLAEMTRANASEFEKVLKEEIFEDLQYVQSLEKELDTLQSDKNEFSNEYDILLQECLSKDIMCAILCSFDNIDEQTEFDIMCSILCSFNNIDEQTELQSVFAKPYHVNAKHVSFQSLEESVGSNNMVHNYYLEEAKKKAQLQKDKALNSKPSVITSAKLPNTANGSKPKPRNSYQQPRN